MAAQVNMPHVREGGGLLDAMTRAFQAYNAFSNAQESNAKADYYKSMQKDAVPPQAQMDFLKGGGKIADEQTDGSVPLPTKSIDPDTNEEKTTIKYFTPASIKSPKNLSSSPIGKGPNGEDLLGSFDATTGKYYDASGKEVANPYKLGNAKEAKEPNKDQYSAAQFGKRVMQANSVFDDLTSKGYNRAAPSQGLADYLPNTLKSNELQQQNQAERNFVNAVLRRESGAAISSSEFDSAEKQYFPRAGDSPETLAQKKQNREQALAGLQAEAGPAWEKTPTIALVPPKKGSSGTANASEGDKPKKVIQNGHTYILNEKTGKYE